MCICFPSLEDISDNKVARIASYEDDDSYTLPKGIVLFKIFKGI